MMSARTSLKVNEGPDTHLATDGRVGESTLPCGGDLLDAAFDCTESLDELRLTVEGADLGRRREELESQPVSR